METMSNYINGELVEPKNLKYSRVFNPSTGKVYAKCPESSTADLKSAISSAKKAGPFSSIHSGKKPYHIIVNYENMWHLSR